MTFKKLVIDMLKEFKVKNDKFTLKSDKYQDIVRACHNGMMPDNYKYRFIHESLVLIRDHEFDHEEARHNIESDVYNSDLLKWLSSHIDRASYCDTAISEEYIDIGSSDFNTIHLISVGQYVERVEVFEILVRELLKLGSE